jgi:predicted transcriptional regulator
MSSSTTTSIRLPQELKARVTKLAAAAGVSTHSFIVEAVAERTSMEKARADFERVAQKRWQHYRRTGLSVPIDDMLQYARDLAAGKDVPPPKGRKLAKTQA